MAGSSFGQLFRLTTFGESHGKAIGLIIDGCPAGLDFDEEFLQAQMARRRPGQSEISTARDEADKVEVLSGVFEGKTTGSPIAMLIANKDQRSKDYSHIKDTFRPSHADFTYESKYGLRDYRGGGRASARETACRVAAGAVAQMLLKGAGVEIRAYVSSVGQLDLQKQYSDLDLSKIDSNEVRCPDEETAKQMKALIEQAKSDGDSLGGVITAVVENCPVGLGEPVFDKIHADLGKAMLSINAVKGFEYGSGFAGSRMKGSEHNDKFERQGDKIVTQTNHSGGVQGGITNGMDIYFRVAFKPVATIMQAQESINKSRESQMIEGKGRHDPCVVPRAVPIVEAMAALVLADHYLRNKTAKM